MVVGRHSACSWLVFFFFMEIRLKNICTLYVCFLYYNISFSTAHDKCLRFHGRDNSVLKFVFKSACRYTTIIQFLIRYKLLVYIIMMDYWPRVMLSVDLELRKWVRENIKWGFMNHSSTVYSLYLWTTTVIGFLV